MLHDIRLFTPQVCVSQPNFRSVLMQSVQKYQHFNFFVNVPLLKTVLNNY